VDSLFLVYTLCGAAAGFLAGLLGIGGGILIIPVLFLVQEGSSSLPPEIFAHTVFATSLATIMCTSAASAFAHYRAGNTDKRVLALWGPGVIVGSLAGGAFGAYVPSKILITLYLVCLLFAVQRMLFQTKIPPVIRRPHRVGSFGIGFFIGILSSMLGIGGGVFSVPLMMLVGYTALTAVGTAPIFGFLISAPATIVVVIKGFFMDPIAPGYWGYIHKEAFLVIALFSTMLAPVGARVSSKISTILLRRIFAVVILLGTIKVLFA